jgi:putative addiction module component (TIGR02574 family)
MDRFFEEIRSEVLELDRESQRKLAEEIEHTLAETETKVDEEWRQEIKRRLDNHRRGEGSYVTAEKSLAKGRAMIEEARLKQK